MLIGVSSERPEKHALLRILGRMMNKKEPILSALCIFRVFFVSSSPRIDADK